ncbi:FRG domain-containing protein [Deinococcus planocerae]|uniref:FRG domain-containing protein n=1 Tax=Deinococcus planocerae TaxID=1737569 RepID=UPI000C7EC4A2|nr:FRG domain-containing protein [Deinococcus planocerae]
MHDIRVRSWLELYDVLHSEAWNPSLRRFRSPFVFRGQALDAKLTTTLQRLEGETRDIERHLIRNFRKYAYRSGVDRDLSWYWLALGQHHGLPTRLLDWTSSPMVALHFATAEEELYGQDGVIWMVNFVETNRELPLPLRRLLDREGGQVFTVDMLASYSRRHQQAEQGPVTTFDMGWLEDLEQEAEQPFLLFLEPPSLDERIVQQSALFALLSNPDTALDDWLVEHPATYRKVIIPAELKWEVRDKLDQSNINERTLFPDLGGLSRSLRRYYRLRKDAPAVPYSDLSGRPEQDTPVQR